MISENVDNLLIFREKFYVLGFNQSGIFSNVSNDVVLFSEVASQNTLANSSSGSHNLLHCQFFFIFMKVPLIILQEY